MKEWLKWSIGFAALIVIAACIMGMFPHIFRIEVFADENMAEIVKEVDMCNIKCGEYSFSGRCSSAPEIDYKECNDNERDKCLEALSQRLPVRVVT